MPIYEYQCEKCDERFEELILGGRDDDIECPACGSERTRKLMSAFSWSGGEKSSAVTSGMPATRYSASRTATQCAGSKR